MNTEQKNALNNAEQELMRNIVEYVLNTVNDIFQAEHGTKEVMFDSAKMLDLTKQAKAKLEAEIKE